MKIINYLKEGMGVELIRLTEKYNVLKNYHKTSSYTPSDLEMNKRFISGRIVQITYDMKKIQRLFGKENGK
jgi:hypothetical protein